MNILITGAAGFIGSHLADRYKDHTVVGVDNLTTGRRENFPGDLVYCDIRTGVPFMDWDLIFHCAASYHDRSNWERDASTNVLGTVQVVRAAQDSGAKLVYFQTALCYGLSPKSPVKVTAQLDPVGSYAVSKTAGEAYIRDSGVRWASLRLANIYGPRNVSGPPAAIWKRLSEGKDPVIMDTRRDFVFIDDLLEVAMDIAADGEGVWHVSSGRDYSIMDIYEAVADAMELDPTLPAPEIIPKPDGDAATILLDPSKTEEEYDWKAVTPLRAGIAKAVKWYEQFGVEETFTHLGNIK